MAQGVRLHLFGPGGEVFTITSHVSNESIFSSQYVSREEKLFLQDYLHERHTEFCSSEKFVVFVKECVHPRSSASLDETPQYGEEDGGPIRGKIDARENRYVTFLHGFTGNLTDSWCFLKFVLPIFRNHYDLLLVDLPGFGKSSINNIAYCEPSRWRRVDYKMLTHIIECHKISKTHFLCVGESASVFFKLLKYSKRLIQKRHVLINPIITQEDLADQLEPSKLRAILRHCLTDIYVFYDPRTYCNGENSRQVEKMMETVEILKELALDDIISMQLTLSEFDKGDCVPVQFVPDPPPGVHPVHGLLPSAYFQAFVAEFIAGSHLPPFHASQLVAADRASRDKSFKELEKATKQVSVAVAQRSEEYPESLASPGISTLHVPEISQRGASEETSHQRRNRLSRWKMQPLDPDMSYGVRLRDKEHFDKILDMQKKSEEEYEVIYGEENRLLEKACMESAKSYKEESRDERLIELRNRAPIDEREQIRQWQLAAEESLKLEILHKMTEEELLKKGIEESLEFTVTGEDELDLALRESRETCEIEAVARREK